MGRGRAGLGASTDRVSPQFLDCARTEGFQIVREGFRIVRERRARGRAAVRIKRNRPARPGDVVGGSFRSGHAALDFAREHDPPVSPQAKTMASTSYGSIDSSKPRNRGRVVAAAVLCLGLGLVGVASVSEGPAGFRGMIFGRGDGAERAKTGRVEAAATTRREGEPRPRRECRVDVPWRRVAAVPRVPRGCFRGGEPPRVPRVYSVEASRGDADAAWIFRGGEPPRVPRGYSVEACRGPAAGAAWRRVAATPRVPRGCSAAAREGGSFRAGTGDPRRSRGLDAT